MYPTSANNRNGIETLKTKSYSAFKTKHIQGRRVEPLFVRSQVLFALDSTIMLNLPLSRENNPLVLLGAAFVKQDRLHLKVSTELIGSRHSNTIEQIGKIVIQRIVGTGVTQIYGEPLLCEFIDRALFEDPYRQVSPDSSFMPSHLMVTEARTAHFVEVGVPVLMDDEFRSAKINLRRTKPILEHLIDPKTSQDTKIQHLQSTMDKVTSMHGTENIESYFLGNNVNLMRNFIEISYAKLDFKYISGLKFFFQIPNTRKCFNQPRKLVI